MQTMTLLCGLAAALPVLAPRSPAQGVIPLVQSGETIGAGTIDYVAEVDVTGEGEWTVTVVVDLPEVSDTVVLKGGTTLVQEGDAVHGMAGKVFGSSIQPVLGEGGEVVIRTLLEPSPSVPALFVDGLLVALQGTPIGAPELAPLIPWHVVDSAVINASGALLVRGSAGTTSSSSMTAVKLDPSAGYAASAVVWLGKLLPGQTHGVDMFYAYDGFSDMNDSGDVLFVAHIGGLGGWALYKGDTLLAQEGTPAPLAGFKWSAFGNLDLNNAGGWVTTAILKDAALAPLSAIVKDGAIFVKKGDVLPATAPFPLSEVGGCRTAEDGTVVWRGLWNNQGALFHEQDALIVDDVTQLGSKTVFQVSDYARSDDGRFLVASVYFQDTTYGAYLFDLTGGSLSAVPSCSGNPGSLTAAGGPPALGASFDFVLDAAQAAGALPFVGISSQPAGPGPCGLVLPLLGELLIGVAPPNPLVELAGPAWVGAPVAIPLLVPPVEALVGKHFYAQGIFFDVGGASGEPVRMTDGLLLDIGL